MLQDAWLDYVDMERVVEELDSLASHWQQHRVSPHSLTDTMASTSLNTATSHDSSRMSLSLSVCLSVCLPVSV